MSKPTPGWTTQAKVERVLDGDTIEVSITRRFCVRLIHQNEEDLEFNAPERNTPEGQQAKSALETLVDGQYIILFLPAKHPEKLLDVENLGRILGEVWLDGERVTSILLEEGHGKLLKKGSY